MDIGKVIEIKNNNAIIKLPFREICAKCNMCKRENDKIVIGVPNELGVRVGDKVKIELEGMSTFKAAFIVYLLPILFMFSGYFIGRWIYVLTKIFLISIICGIVIFLTSFLIIHFCDKSLNRKKKPPFKMVGIIK